MTRTISFFLFGLLSVAGQGALPNRAIASVSHRCGGGSDGPKPLTTISQDWDFKVVPTEGGVSEFLFWEAHNSVVYRSALKLLHFLPLDTGLSRPISPLSTPLSRTVSSDFRFLATEGQPWVFDASAGRWLNYHVGHTDLTHLFFDRGRLYSVASEKGADGLLLHHFYRYRVGEAEATPICTLKGGLLARGHSHPYAYFFSTQPYGEGYRLTLHDFDVRRCRIVSDLEFKDPLIGPVIEVHRMPQISSNLIAIDHPLSNLLWHDSNEGCNYYWIPGGRPLVINSSVPIIGTFAPKVGLNLVFLKEEKTLPLLRKFPLQAIAANDLWLTDSADRLFVTPQIYGKMEKPLLMMGVGKLPK